MTEENFKLFESFESVFERAVRFNYCRLSQSEWKKLIVAYNQETGSNLSLRACRSCSAAKTIKRIAAFYYAEKEERAKTSTEILEEVDSMMADLDNTPLLEPEKKVKRTRKSKEG